MNDANKASGKLYGQKSMNLRSNLVSIFVSPLGGGGFFIGYHFIICSTVQSYSPFNRHLSYLYSHWSTTCIKAPIVASTCKHWIYTPGHPAGVAHTWISYKENTPSSQFNLHFAADCHKGDGEQATFPAASGKWEHLTPSRWVLRRRFSFNWVNYCLLSVTSSFPFKCSTHFN